MDNYQLSEAAAADLDNHYLYGIMHFGLKKADAYYDGLIERLKLLSQHPDWGNDYAYIAPNLHRYEYGSHSIYYQTKSHSILIVRILGSRQDPARHM